MRCGELRLRSHWMVVENSTRAPVFASKARLACLACTKLWQTHLPTKKVSCHIQQLGKTAFSGMQANEKLCRTGQAQGLEHRRITWMFTTGLVRVGHVGSFFRIPLWIYSCADVTTPRRVKSAPSSPCSRSWWRASRAKFASQISLRSNHINHPEGPSTDVFGSNETYGDSGSVSVIMRFYNGGDVGQMIDWQYYESH
jgi:hypothetical protein